MNVAILASAALADLWGSPDPVGISSADDLWGTGTVTSTAADLAWADSGSPDIWGSSATIAETWAQSQYTSAADLRHSKIFAASADEELIPGSFVCVTRDVGGVGALSSGGDGAAGVAAMLQAAQDSNGQVGARSSDSVIAVSDVYAGASALTMTATPAALALAAADPRA